MLTLWIQVKIPLEITFSNVVMAGRLHTTVRRPFVSLHWKGGFGGTMGGRGYRRWGFMGGAPVCDVDPRGIPTPLFKRGRRKPDTVTG